MLIIHGERDELIPATHGRLLQETLFKQKDDKKKQNENFDYLPYCDAKFHAHMTHNDFHMNNDIMTPMKEFIQSVIPLYENQNKFWFAIHIREIVWLALPSIEGDTYGILFS